MNKVLSCENHLLELRSLIAALSLSKTLVYPPAEQKLQIESLKFRGKK